MLSSSRKNIMKKIAIVSDLHLEFWRHSFDDKLADIFGIALNRFIDFCHANNCDTLIIAGDVYEKFSFIPFKENINEVAVVFVPGNHDFYGSVWPVDFNSQVLVDDDYIATTLWTRFHDLSNVFASNVFRSINDLYHITGSSSAGLKDRFYASLASIEAYSKEVIITHFPPNLRSLDPKYAGSSVNSYFINDIPDSWFEKNNHIKLWVCGHTHSQHTYRVHDTLVVCHPLGYPAENYTDIDDYVPLIVEKNDANLWDVVYSD